MKYSLTFLVKIAGLIFFIFLSALPSIAQYTDQWNLTLSNATYISSDRELPFWFHSNKFGRVQNNSANSIFSIGLEKVFSGASTFDYRAKASPIARLSKDSKFFFDELFIGIKAGPFRLDAGKKRWRDGIGLSDLSMGSMVWSGNAATMPKMMLSVPEYLEVPFTRDFVAFRGYIGHGWFGDDQYVSGAFLHEKAFYLRFMPESFWLNGHIGIIHNVQWGGTHPDMGELPQGLSDFGRVFLGKSAAADRSPGGEIVNALGNTVGAYEAKLDFDIRKLRVKAYRQFFIETSVSSRIRSPWDGLWGVELEVNDATKTDWLTHFIWEHVNTKRQNAKPGEEIGADQYYANYLYRSGWTYKGRVIGLPLAYTDEVGNVRQVVNNIIVAHHFGLKGNIPISALTPNAVSYELLATYSRNYGRTTSCSGDFCDEGEANPLRTPRTDAVYTQLIVEYPLSRFVKTWGGVGVDFGSINNAVGVHIGAAYSIF